MGERIWTGKSLASKEYVAEQGDAKDVEKNLTNLSIEERLVSFYTS
ncbi:hypothetical protein [Bacillus weihaiensis]|nr:hypothetical protein [Bacillus weihaiensis]